MEKRENGVEGEWKNSSSLYSVLNDLTGFNIAARIL